MTHSVTLPYYHSEKMEDIYIEPDPGQQTQMEINDYGDAIYSAYKYGNPVYIGQIRVTVLEYEELGPLNFTDGHRAKVCVERV